MNNNELIQGYVQLIKDSINTYRHHHGYHLPWVEQRYEDDIKLVEKYSGKSWEELKGE